MAPMLDEHDLDDRWRAGLQAGTPRVDATGAAARVRAHVARRTRRRRATGALGVVALLAAVIVGIALSRDTGRTTLHTAGDGHPALPATLVHVASLPTLQLTMDRTTVPAGLVQIDYADKGGTHVLRIAGIPASRFELRVPRGPTTATIRLHRGDYELYCSIPGHADAGERAVLTVR